jgi:hypothetical protein
LGEGSFLTKICKMKILSNKYKGVSVRLFNKEVEFDSNGEAEVSKDFGERVNAEYNINIKAAKKVELPKTDEGLQEAIEALESEKKILTERVGTLTEDVDAAKVETQTWKDEWQKVVDGSSDKDLVVKTTVKDITFVVDLMKKNKGDLDAMAAELELPKEEWDPLNKENLVVYLATKALDANA